MTDVNWQPGLWPQAVWDQFITGYECGLASGHDAGFVDGQYAEAVRKGPAEHVPDEIDRAFAYVAARRDARRAETANRPLTAQEIRAKAEASWAEVEQQIRSRVSA